MEVNIVRLVEEERGLLRENNIYKMWSKESCTDEGNNELKYSERMRKV